MRVGLEKQHGLSPESRMTVLDDFSAGADDELNVESGQTVYMLYTEQEWMYVLVEDGREGFIPRWVGVHRVSCLLGTSCAMFSTSCATFNALCVMFSAPCVMF